MTRNVPEFEGAAAVGVLVEEERVTVSRLGVVGVVSHQDLCGINIQRPFSQKSIDINMLIHVELSQFERSMYSRKEALRMPHSPPMFRDHSSR